MISKAAGFRFSAIVERLEERIVLSTTWYVSLAGADSNPGTLARPLRHIQAAANAAHPGDTIVIRGGTYRETVTPPRSGAAGKPIVFEPYGNETVTVSGADVVSGWSSAGGQLFDTPLAWDLGAGKNQLFVDGTMASEARWPNPGPNLSKPAMATIKGVSIVVGANDTATATITDAALTQPAGWWVGAGIRFLPGQGWTAQTGTVVSSSPGKLSFTYNPLGGPYQTLSAGNKFDLFGTRNAMISGGAGEWYRDSSGKLYFNAAAGDSPAKHLVEVKHRPWAFDLSGRSFIVLQGIKIVSAGIISDAGSHDLTLNHLSASYVAHLTLMNFTGSPPGVSGIILQGTHELLENSTVVYSAGDGVAVGGTGNKVVNCVIHDVDYAAGDWAGIRGTGASGDSLIDNTVYNAGRSGIVFSYCPTSTVTGNTVHDVGLQTTDCGGIYTYGTNGTGSIISYNTVYAVHTGGFGGVGLYLDNNSSHYLLSHNTASNVDHGMKMNPTSEYNLIEYNSLAGSTDAVVGSGKMTGTALIDNKLSGKIILGIGTTSSGNT